MAAMFTESVLTYEYIAFHLVSSCRPVSNCTLDNCTDCQENLQPLKHQPESA